MYFENNTTFGRKETWLWDFLRKVNFRWVSFQNSFQDKMLNTWVFNHMGLQFVYAYVHPYEATLRSLAQLSRKQCSLFINFLQFRQNFRPKNWPEYVIIPYYTHWVRMVAIPMVLPINQGCTFRFSLQVFSPRGASSESTTPTPSVGENATHWRVAWQMRKAMI